MRELNRVVACCAAALVLTACTDVSDPVVAGSVLNGYRLAASSASLAIGTPASLLP